MPAVGEVMATAITEEEMKTATGAASERAEEDSAPRTEKKEKEKEEKPKSLAAFKVRWHHECSTCTREWHTDLESWW